MNISNLSDKTKQIIIVSVLVTSVLGISGTYVYSLATGALLVLPTAALYGSCIYIANGITTVVRKNRKSRPTIFGCDIPVPTIKWRDVSPA